MKRQPLRDIAFLLGSLTAFSMGIGMFFGNKAVQETIEEKITPENEQFLNFSTQQIIEFLTALIDSGSISKLSESLQDMPINQLLPVIETLVKDDQNRINLIQKLDLIFSLVRTQKSNEDAYKLLNFIGAYKGLRAQPILYVAALTKNERAIPLILSWATEKKYPIIQWEQEAFNEAVGQSKPLIIEKLLSAGIPMNAHQATQLLWRAIEGKRTVALVPLLLKKGAHINDERQGNTPLIKAVQVKDEGMVRELVNRGADISLIADPSVGNALQQAIQLNLANIQEFLREKGGRE